jgi:hypothetical protein
MKRIAVLAAAISLSSSTWAQDQDRERKEIHADSTGFHDGGAGA